MNTTGTSQAERAIQERGAYAQLTSQRGARAKVLALFEAVLVYAVLQALLVAWRGSQVVKWEFQNLGWSYTAGLLFVVLPALVIWLAGPGWRSPTSPPSP